MALLGRWKKQPGERLAYSVDFTDWLAERPGNTIASYTVQVAPVGITVVTHAKTGAVISVLLSGGTEGVSYKVTIAVTTSASNELKEAEFSVTIKEV